jgi:hypothetical protein
MAPERAHSNRFRIEAVAAVVFLLAAIVTAIWPDWIEEVFHVDPDHGDGALEWIIVAILGVVALVLAALAVRDRPARRVVGGEST